MANKHISPILGLPSSEFVCFSGRLECPGRAINVLVLEILPYDFWFSAAWVAQKSVLVYGITNEDGSSYNRKKVCSLTPNLK